MSSAPRLDNAQVLAGAIIKVLVIEGRDLIAKDRSLLGIRSTSDPYVVLDLGYEEPNAKKKQHFFNMGRTNTVMKNNKNPQWKEFFEIALGARQAERLLKQRDCLKLQIWDQDVLSRDDFMGLVTVDIIDAAMLGPLYKAYPVEKGTGKLVCKNAKGILEVQVTLEARKIIRVERGSTHLLADSNILAGVAWTVEQGRLIDIDYSCVAVDNQGKVRLEDTVYYDHLTNSDGSLVHSGDERSGLSEDENDDDEVITMDLNKMPSYIVALYFVLTISQGTWADVHSARIRFSARDTGFGICEMVPSDLVGKNNHNTALFLLRVSRGKDDPNKWYLTPIGDGDERARDFGTLIPQLRHYTKDLVPNMGSIDPFERVALLKKVGTIRLAEYLDTIPTRLTMGLAWHVTDGATIDLDASAILLGHDYDLKDIVWFGHSTSDNNGSVVHTGDEKYGFAGGDDEQIHVNLHTVPKDVKYIGFSINSFSGEALKYVCEASCHFFNPDDKNAMDIARHVMVAADEFRDKTGLLMVCLFRGDTDENDWYLHILSKPVNGRKAQENLADWQEYCKRMKSLPSQHQEVFRDMPESFPSTNETQLISPQDLDKIFPKRK